MYFKYNQKHIYNYDVIRLMRDSLYRIVPGCTFRVGTPKA